MRTVDKNGQVSHDSYEDFLTDEKEVWVHLDRYAHVYNPTKHIGLSDFIRQIDKMTHKERVDLIEKYGFLKPN